MIKKRNIVLGLVIMSTIFCNCKKTKVDNQTLNSTFDNERMEQETAIVFDENPERDYFLCPDWIDYLENGYMEHLYSFEIFNSKDIVKSIEIYKLKGGEKGLFRKFVYERGKIIEDYHYPDTADDYSFIYEYDNNRLIRQYEKNYNNEIIEEWNYSYSYDKEKKELVCKCVDTHGNVKIYTEIIQDGTYHLSKQVNQNKENYCIAIINGILSRIEWNSSTYNDEKIFFYDGDKTQLQTFSDGELCYWEDFVKNNDNSATWEMYYGNSLSEGRFYSKREFTNFDKYDNWTLCIEKNESYERIFEYEE